MLIFEIKGTYKGKWIHDFKPDRNNSVILGTKKEKQPEKTPEYVEFLHLEE